MSNRPKRRKFKDNPYTIIEIEISNKYFVTFKDSRGIFNKVEVSKDIYELFNYYELRDLSQMNEYDNYGNILSKKVYIYNTTTLLSENTYSYENSNWQDLLTKFNNELITYDNIGNPLTIGNKTLTWMNGRELSTYNDGSNNISYKYNIDGIRTSKVVNNVETKYYLEGTKIIFEDRNGTVLYYLYNGDVLLGFVYNGTIYYYHKNIFGDILGILNSNYEKIVTYEYDSWGAISNIADNSGINLGTINPFRYRSYYYDEETKLYYLNSRYYNPEWGRFVNEDDVLNTGNKFFSKNLFTYSSNNPVMGYDPLGHFSLWDFLDIVSFVDSAVNMVKNPSWENAGWLALDTVSLVPIVPSVSSSGKTIAKTTKATKTIKASKRVQNVVEETTQQGWKLGDDINVLTKNGNYPSWETVRKRYWKNEAFLQTNIYNESNLLRMKSGKAPLVQFDNGLFYPKELHHIDGRNIPDAHNINNLLPVMPWEHSKIDKHRHFKP